MKRLDDNYFNIIRLDSVDSTSNYMKEHPELWADNFTTIAASQQTLGRGRMGRSWHSEAGSDLTFSTIFNPGKEIKNPSVITILSGLAVYNVLIKLVPRGLNLKWPNDIYHDSKKIGGILCELMVKNNSHYIAIGIGINVNSTEFPPGISDTAESLKSITGKDHSTDELLLSILNELKALLEKMSIPLDHSLISLWKNAASSIGSHIYFFVNGKKEEGTIADINTSGTLKIITKAGQEIEDYAGEVEYKS